MATTKRVPWSIPMAALLGFGGIATAVILVTDRTAWCSNHLFIGCVVAAIGFAVGGWVSGTVASLFSLGAEGGWKIAARALLAYNALGIAATLISAIMVVNG
jgi:hypothetical protein